MDHALASLIAANVSFVGTHIAMSHPLRTPMVRVLGERGFQGVYSLVSLACLVWIVLAFQQVGPGKTTLWNGQGEATWIAASLLTLLALALIAGSFKGNPAVVGAGAAQARAAAPTGVFAITRHPMMWGIAIWALAHVMVAPDPRNLITAGSLGLFALLGAHLQDRKKAALLGADWTAWQARTSYWPRLGAIGAIGLGSWLRALVLWLLFTWLHLWAAYVPAGIWRWVG